MAFLDPHFKLDAFVSYSHGKVRGTDEPLLKTWTHALVQRLESQIVSLDTEFDDLHIWMDKQIDPTAQLTEELRSKVEASGILIIVISKRYLGSNWCRDELDWFKAQIEQRSGDIGRVFVLRAQPTDTASWPEFLRDERGHAMTGFRFYDQGTGLPQGWPDLKDTDRAFTQELCRLQTALTKRLRELRERAEKRARAEATRTDTVRAEATRADTIRAPSNQPALGKRRIYLHASTPADPARAEIDGALSQDGIVSMTAHSEGKGGIAAWQKDARLRMHMAKRCEALALLRADDDGERFTDDVFEIGVDERERIVDARGTPMPCAVLDKSGAGAPPELAQLDIEHFDVTKDGWRGSFKSWLDANRVEPEAAQP